MNWTLLLSQFTGILNKKITIVVWMLVVLAIGAWIMGFRRGNKRGYRVGVRHARIECRQSGGRIPINPDDVPPLVRPRPFRPWTWRIWYPRPDRFSITDEELKTDEIMQMMPEIKDTSSIEKETIYITMGPDKGGFGYMIPLSK